MRLLLNIRSLGCPASLLLLLLPGLSGAAEGTPSPSEEVVRARWLMGTVLEVRLPAGTPGAAAHAEAAFEEVSRVEAAASLWKPGTELGQVHARTAAGLAAALSEVLGDLVRESLRVAALTGGAYSPAVGALVEGWDLRGEGRWLEKAERRRLAHLARTEGVLYDPSTRTLRLERGVTLDLDGIAKGYALDRAAAALRVRGVDDALLNFGGQLLAVGPPSQRPPREALVASPSDPAVSVLSVRIRDASLSTSANSERVRKVAGKEAGHLLDPRTGELVSFSGSVSVLAPTGALADALSTAWAVRGPGAFCRSAPGSALRTAGAVAFVLPNAGGEWKTLTDRPFLQLRTSSRAVDAAVP